ncbi:hypothetical protein B0H14DRAFT_3672674 [Mycena olivaceomarginata]|nr:hypothetical protein B0H14DRAFT_3672674 [Mycena olivaceomarginata]
MWDYLGVIFGPHGGTVLSAKPQRDGTWRSEFYLRSKTKTNLPWINRRCPSPLIEDSLRDWRWKVAYFRGAPEDRALLRFRALTVMSCGIDGCDTFKAETQAEEGGGSTSMKDSTKDGFGVGQRQFVSPLHPEGSVEGEIWSFAWACSRRSITIGVSDGCRRRATQSAGGGPTASWGGLSRQTLSVGPIMNRRGGLEARAAVLGNITGFYSLHTLLEDFGMRGFLLSAAPPCHDRRLWLWGWSSGSWYMWCLCGLRGQAMANKEEKEHDSITTSSNKTPQTSVFVGTRRDALVGVGGTDSERYERIRYASSMTIQGDITTFLRNFSRTRGIGGFGSGILLIVSTTLQKYLAKDLDLELKD